MKIMIVDDHALVLRGMSYLVKEGFPDVDVLEADGTAAALEIFRAGTKIDLALVDVRLPNGDGLELLRTIKAQWPGVPVIILSTYDNTIDVRRALVDGAAGYLLKEATPKDLLQAIDVALSGGGNVLSPRVIQNLIEDLDSGTTNGGSNGHRKGQRSPNGLTQRENDILALLAEGQSNRQIAQGLFLSEKTVKAHLAAVYRKLDVANRTQAAMLAVRMGIGRIPVSSSQG
jgi:two-component system, NarL family, response regulator DegU